MSEKKKILLIVEDEISLLKILQEEFSKEGFDVITAIDGVSGLDLALTKRPDLILLDLILPKMDGLSLLRELRKDSWGMDVPVIILSNLSDAEKISEASEHEVFDYLVKADWKLEDVIKKVKNKLKVA
ncbi:MAG: response regulator [Candidatus Magasanikbacteria bacterium]|nr:response regulator [Candidatus Magasanikbacteria bacterium]